MPDSSYPVTVQVLPVTEQRNRLTTFFRFFLSIPHLILVGGPAAGGAWLTWQTEEGMGWSTSGGVIGAAAAVVVLISWFAIMFTGSHPGGLWRFTAYYLRWRVRVIAYLMLLRDEYPPFGDESYPAELVLPEPTEPRDRVKVFLRILLAIPQLIVLALLFPVWALTTGIAWVLILVTGRYPEMLYGFGLGMLAWSARVEAYVLLLRDEYPPFTLRT
jgi:hypothetical protein